MDMWQRQWARVNRWYDRFGKIDAGVEHYKSSDFSDDEMWSFFINCYHFKDWLKNDPASGLSNQARRRLRRQVGEPQAVR